MISWHRVGQKVAVVDGKTEWVCTWAGGNPASGRQCPAPGQVCTIVDVRVYPDGVYFVLGECDPFGQFWARWFRPVYPAITDLIRSIDAPVPLREVETV